MTNNADMYSTVVSLMGEPNCFAGMVLLYTFTFIITIMGAIGSFIIAASVIRRVIR